MLELAKKTAPLTLSEKQAYIDKVKLANLSHTECQQYLQQCMQDIGKTDCDLEEAKQMEKDLQQRICDLKEKQATLRENLQTIINATI